MLKTIEGIYRDGKIELAESAGNIPEETPVIVTFLEPRGVDLRTRGIRYEPAPSRATATRLPHRRLMPMRA